MVVQGLFPLQVVGSWAGEVTGRDDVWVGTSAVGVLVVCGGVCGGPGVAPCVGGSWTGGTVEGQVDRVRVRGPTTVLGADLRVWGPEVRRGRRRSGLGRYREGRLLCGVRSVPDDQRRLWTFRETRRRAVGGGRALRWSRSPVNGSQGRQLGERGPRGTGVTVDL